MTCVHFKGKTEVAAVTEEPIPGLPGAENGVVIFKVLRSPADARDRGKTAIVGRNPEALWFDDYADRVIIDEAGLFDYFRRPQPVPVAPAREGSTSAGAPRRTPVERRRGRRDPQAPRRDPTHAIAADLKQPVAPRQALGVRCRHGRGGQRGL